MKKFIFCATVAFSCCGVSPLFAQFQVLTGNPTPAPRFAAAPVQSGEITESDALTFADSDGSQSSNPFDLGNSEPSAAPAEDPASLATGDEGAGDLVDTLVDYSIVTNTPHASTAPMQWCNSARTPNPVADILLRDYCSRGLWDAYPAERAAQCAKMWAKINSAGCCGGCCGSACSSCAVCTSGCKVKNRYRKQKAPACDQGCATGCDTIAAPAYPSAAPMEPQQVAPAAPAATMPVPSVPISGRIGPNVAAMQSTVVR